MYRFIKRLFDILFSLVGIIFLIPTFLLIKIAYICTGDFGRIIYSQTRIGKNGKPFKMYKFRTMVPDADKQLARLLQDKKYKAEYQKNHKIHDDPRMTIIGKIIRKASIDELPQEINVLLGQMSVIGNRPYLIAEKKEMGKYFKSITSVKPGITGYWQVSGRNNLSFRDRLIIEDSYSDKAAFWLDVKIFFRTIGAVFSRRGAK